MSARRITVLATLFITCLSFSGIAEASQEVRRIMVKAVRPKTAAQKRVLVKAGQIMLNHKDFDIKADAIQQGIRGENYNLNRFKAAALDANVIGVTFRLGKRNKTTKKAELKSASLKVKLTDKADPNKAAKMVTYKLGEWSSSELEVLGGALEYYFPAK